MSPTLTKISCLALKLISVKDSASFPISVNVSDDKAFDFYLLLRICVGAGV